MSQVSQRFWPRWSLALLAGIVGLYLTLAILIPPGADTLWRLHIANGLWNGQVLYRDIIEVNPPLWFWGAMPAAMLGGYPALVAINLFVSLLGVWMFAALLRLTQTRAHMQWAPVLGLAIGLLWINVGEIGQREQAFLLSCALWCGLAAARIEGKAVTIWLAIVSALFAAYGFALKHYFVLVPIAIEVMVIWHKRRAWAPVRPENLVLAGLAMTYACAIVYVTPEFFSRTLGLVQASYFGFGSWNTVTPLQRSVLMVMICSFVIVPFLAAFLLRTKNTLVQLVLLALAISVLVVLLQQKGWRYHLICAYGLSILTMALLWRSADTDQTSGIFRLVVPVGFAALVFNGFVQPALMSLRTNGQPMSRVLESFIAREPMNRHIAILSTAPENAFYPMARAGRPHWSRHYSMWMMPGLLSRQIDPKREVLRLAQYAIVLREFTADLTCTPPDVIVGETGYFGNPNPKIFDAMAFLKEDPAFAAWLQAYYRRAADSGPYPVWRLSGTRPNPKNCSMPLSLKQSKTRQ